MASKTDQSDDIDLRSLWQTAVRSLPRLVVVGALLGAFTYGALSMVAPRYESETQLAIESKSTANPFADPTRGGSSDSVAVRMDREAVNTHVRVLMSTDLAERIVREMKLAERVEFNPLLGAPDAMSALLRRVGIGRPASSITPEAWALEAYFERLAVYAVRDSRFIVVRFASSDPDLAAQVSNRIAETYRENLAHLTLAETDEVQQALKPKIARLAEEAAAAEAEVERFRGEANIFKGGQQATGLNEQQLAELNAELTKVQTGRSEAEARAMQAREMQKAGSAETLADVQKSPLIQNLVQSRVRVERQISELSATLLPGHPRMRQLSADLTGLKRQINAEVAKIVDGLGKEARLAAAREDAIKKSVEQIKARIVGAGPEEAKLRSLEADAKSKRAELDRLRAQYEANRVRADDSRTIPVEAQIVSTARPSSTPVFPKKAMSALLVAVASVLIGLALVVTRGLLSSTGAGAARVRSGPEARGGRDIVVPRLPGTPSREAPRAGPLSTAPLAPPRVPAPASLASEPPPAPSPVRTLAPTPAPAPVPQAAAPLNVEPAPVSPPPSHVAETPRPAPASTAVMNSHAMAERLEAMRKSGLSGTRTLLAGGTDSVSLAAEASAVGRALTEKGAAVMLIDWSMDGSGISEPLGEPAWPGFAELLDGKVGFEDIVRALADSDVQLIPSGQWADADPQSMDAASLNFALDALDDVYEHIIVVAQMEPARDLFEAIEGRFDAGVLLRDGSQFARRPAEPPGTFLGFEVDGIALFTLDTAKEEAEPRSATPFEARMRRRELTRAS